jgi:hypothetical protein
MMQKWSALMGVLAVVAAAGLLLSLSSCARDQELTNITIQPATEIYGSTTTPVFLDAGLNVQLRALGSYAHPPITKDLTNQVVWNSNTPQMVTVNSTGLITATGDACGNTLVSATVTTSKSEGNIVTGYMTATVVCFTGNGSTQPAVLVKFGGGTGFTNSMPTGLSCSTTCAALFPPSTPITITATPIAPSTIATWSGCDSTSGNVCTINGLTNNETLTVTVTFN